MNVMETLLAAGPVVTDGAWGTQLQVRGLAAGESPDCWNLSHPEKVEEVARAYADAGSRVILTNTFRANRISMPGAALDEINRRGVEISRRAAAGRAKVFASIGPSGKMLLSGEVGADELRAAFAEQARALAAGGADALVVETMSDLEECKVALEAALATGLPVVASMVFDAGRKKDRTMMGSTPEQVAGELTAAGAHVVGANCGCGVAGYVEICRRMRASTGRPLWIKANAGMPELVDGRPVYRMSAAEYAEYVPALREAGAGFIGGCCGTGPEFIRAIRDRLASCA
ncbi:MAG: homocysteine S-methyltransferase family protein [Acidobacteria bacterium]|nr:homocysteine S-methyltransferase family protein [Acidobacteriota bacterium]